jgi:hypothetical protein
MKKTAGRIVMVGQEPSQSNIRLFILDLNGPQIPMQSNSFLLQGFRGFPDGKFFPAAAPAQSL